MEKQPPLEHDFRQEEWEDISGALDTIFRKEYSDSKITRLAFGQILDHTRDNSVKANKVVLKLQSFEPGQLHAFDLQPHDIRADNLKYVFDTIYKSLFGEDMYSE